MTSWDSHEHVTLHAGVCKVIQVFPLWPCQRNGKLPHAFSHPCSWVCLFHKVKAKYWMVRINWLSLQKELRSISTSITLCSLLFNICYDGNHSHDVIMFRAYSTITITITTVDTVLWWILVIHPDCNHSCDVSMPRSCSMLTMVCNTVFRSQSDNIVISMTTGSMLSLTVDWRRCILRWTRRKSPRGRQLLI